MTPTLDKSQAELYGLKPGDRVLAVTRMGAQSLNDDISRFKSGFCRIEQLQVLNPDGTPVSDKAAVVIIGRVRAVPTK
ncbi:hypothetical protein HYV64_03630 [Candidatus Shapirobacteria bacterium]|nr:hypothetical protein [Candidatus Shapirobacteria bacterium]